jgi:hypothetical protein
LARRDIASNIPFGLLARYRVVLNGEMEIASASEICGSADFIVEVIHGSIECANVGKTVSYVEIKRSQEE